MAEKAKKVVEEKVVVKESKEAKELKEVKAELTEVKTELSNVKSREAIVAKKNKVTTIIAAIGAGLTFVFSVVLCIICGVLVSKGYYCEFPGGGYTWYGSICAFWAFLWLAIGILVFAGAFAFVKLKR